MNKAGAYLSIFTKAVSREFPDLFQEVLNIIIRSSLIFSFFLFNIFILFFFLSTLSYVYLLRHSRSPGNDFTFKEHFAVRLIFNIHFFFTIIIFFFLPVLLTASRATNSQNHALFNPKNCVKITRKKKKLLFKSRIFYKTLSSIFVALLFFRALRRKKKMFERNEIFIDVIKCPF